MLEQVVPGQVSQTVLIWRRAAQELEDVAIV